MTFALLVLLAATPDAGTPAWKKSVEAPVKSELYSRKPNIEKSTDGKVLPAFASPVAFAKSKHPAMNDWSAAHRATFDVLVELATQKKPELADAIGGIEREPVPVRRLSELELKLNPRAKLITEVMGEAACCGESLSNEIQKLHPTRVRRDAEGRIIAALVHGESFSTRGNSVKNAHRHDDEWFVYTFSDDGRITGFATFFRADAKMRLGPEIQLKVCTPTWAQSGIASVECFESADDGDEFNFVTTRTVWN